MAAGAIWTDREMLDVLEAHISVSAIIPRARFADEWAIALADYGLAVEGIERTGAKRGLTVPIARRRVLRPARRMGKLAGRA